MPERLAEKKRPGLGEGAEGGFRAFERTLGIATLALGHLARGFEPGLPNLIARRVLDAVFVQHLLDQRGELPLLKLQQRAVAVEGDGADGLDRLVGTDRRGCRFGRRLLVRFAHGASRFLSIGSMVR